MVACKATSNPTHSSEQVLLKIFSSTAVPECIQQTAYKQFILLEWKLVWITSLLNTVEILSQPMHDVATDKV